MAKILRLKNVIAMTGLSRSSIYSFQKSGSFPRSMKLSERSVGWLEADVTGWIANKAGEKKS
ncbi:MAG TPA: AlpA family phage regulatory protein [Methylotenera sp.]|nr:AlpA family phage regulatory protein [Methylotenera sp.]HPH06111.1 AlpA family phage regulatory protein [Methylotenera sp.]